MGLTMKKFIYIVKMKSNPRNQWSEETSLMLGSQFFSFPLHFFFHRYFKSLRKIIESLSHIFPVFVDYYFWIVIFKILEIHCYGVVYYFLKFLGKAFFEHVIIPFFFGFVIFANVVFVYMCRLSIS